MGGFLREKFRTALEFTSTRTVLVTLKVLVPKADAFPSENRRLNVGGRGQANTSEQVCSARVLAPSIRRGERRPRGHTSCIPPNKYAGELHPGERPRGHTSCTPGSEDPGDTRARGATPGTHEPGERPRGTHEPGERPRGGYTVDPGDTRVASRGAASIPLNKYGSHDLAETDFLAARVQENETFVMVARGPWERLLEQFMTPARIT